MFSFREIVTYLVDTVKKMRQTNQKEPSFRALDSSSSLESLIARSQEEPVVLFKHSLTCGISSMVHRRMETLTEDSDPPVYILHIQSARTLSEQVASHFTIRHESPQVIVVYKGEPVFHTSHSAIRTDSIREATASVLLK